MCEEIFFMEENGVQKKEHGRKLCVVVEVGVHRIISMTSLWIFY
jgi:hypothetical protein